MLAHTLQKTKSTDELIEAIKLFTFYEIEAYIEQEYGNVNATFGENQSPLLILAILAEREDIVKLLLQRGANPDTALLAWQAQNLTPANDKQNELVEEVRKIRGFHSRILKKADNPESEQGLYEDIKNYLDLGGDSNLTNNGVSLLICASSRRGCPDIVELLLKHQADPHLDDPSGNYALAHANAITNKNNKKQIVAALKKAGARQYSSHPIKLLRKLGYTNIFSYFGVCHGLACVGMDYMMRGTQGIKELDNLLLALGNDNKDVVEVAKKIKDIELARMEFVNLHKDNLVKKIKDEIKRKLHDEVKAEEQSDQKIKIVYELLLEEKNVEIERIDETIILFIDNLIKIKFGIIESERKFHVDKIFQNKLQNNCSVDQDELEEAIWETIHHDVLKKLKDMLLQKRLDNELRAELYKKYGRDSVLLDAPSYLQSIAISQSPGNYKKYFEKNIPSPSQNAFLTFPLVSSTETEKHGFATPPDGLISRKFNKIELIDFLNEWEKNFREEPLLSKPVVFMFGGHMHAVSLAYLPQENAWAYNGFSGKKTLITKNVTNLVDEIFNDFYFSASKEVRDLECSVYSSKKDEDKINSCLDKVRKKLEPESKTKRVLKAAGIFVVGLICLAACIGGAIWVGPAAGLSFALYITGAVGSVSWMWDATHPNKTERQIERQNEAIRANVARDAAVPKHAEKKLSNNRINERLEEKTTVEIKDEPSPLPSPKLPPKKSKHTYGSLLDSSLSNPLLPQEASRPNPVDAVNANKSKGKIING